MSRWTEMFAALSGGPDTVDTMRHSGDRPTSLAEPVPSRPSVTALATDRAPRVKADVHAGAAITERDDAWVEALDRLDPNEPPGDVPPLRWGRFIDDARKFLASDWPRQAADLGWTALELFGCHSIAPYARHDCKGLVWSLGECGGGKLVAITAETAVIERPTGSRQTFYRRPHAGTEVVLPWEARLSEDEEAGLPQSSTSRGAARSGTVDDRNPQIEAAPHDSLILTAATASGPASKDPSHV